MVCTSVTKSTRTTKNVVVFGESGVGKSSLINLIAGERVTETSSGALGCTLQYKRHPVVLHDQQVAVWDTAGLDEGAQGSVPAEKAEAYLKQLLHDLARNDGIDLLIYCVRGARVRSALLTNYHIFYSAICRKKVPIAIVITGLENQEGGMETWWDNNKPQFSSLGMLFDSHACVTTLGPAIENPLLAQRRETSRTAVIKMITTTCRIKQWKPPERSWIESAYSDIRAMLFPKDVPVPRLANIIMCEVDRNYSDRPSPRRCSFSFKFHNPIAISLSLNSVSFRSPVSVSDCVPQNRLPFECGVRRTPERLYRVYHVSPDGAEEDTKKVTVIRRAADLLIFCVKMEEAEINVISQWEYFNITYGGDLSPQLVVVVGALDRSSAKEWWQKVVGGSSAVDDVLVAHCPENTRETNAVDARNQLRCLIDDHCIDYSKVTSTRDEELFRRSLYLDISRLTPSLWGKPESYGKDNGPAVFGQDILTEAGVWEVVPEQSSTTTTLSSPKEYQGYFI